MKRLRPFFSYYGSKWRLAPKYPAPIYDHIIEPFAGSAQYATLYYDRKITLVDKNEKVCGVWDYLIRSKPSDIMALPSEVFHIDDFPNLCQEAKWLIGFWLNKGKPSPRKTMCSWGRMKTTAGNFWGEKIRCELAENIQIIKHWKIICGCFTNLANPQATWFIDPPYNNTNISSHYLHNEINYRSLVCWSFSRIGQIIVCENEGSKWLPFEFLADTKSTNQHYGNRYSHEMLYHRINQ